MSAPPTENQFENVSAGTPEQNFAEGMNATASGGVAESGAAVEVSGPAAENATPATATNATPETATNATPETANASVESAATASGPADENEAPAAPVTTSGYVMSAKAKDLQERRKALLEDMRAEYTKVFGDDKKAPKAKAWQAAGLLTIKEKQGNAAYKAKLQEYIASNQSKYSGKTVKAPKVRAQSFNSSAVSMGPATPENARAIVIKSVQTMSETVKGLMDTIVTATRSLASSKDMTAVANKVAAVANQNATPKTARKPRSNKGKHHKSRKLSPVKE